MFRNRKEEQLQADNGWGTEHLATSCAKANDSVGQRSEDPLPSLPL